MSDVFSLFVKGLTVLDCALLHPVRGPIGMSWNVDIEFIGDVNEHGMVFDFSKAKKFAKNYIDTKFDHAFIIPISIRHSECYEYVAPVSAVCVVTHTTPNAIAARLEDGILDSCVESLNMSSLRTVKITLNEEKDPNSFYYHYTHGLKTHDGNCQRILHGHRSTVEVFVNGTRDTQLEIEVCNFYDDKHLSYWKNIEGIDTKDGVDYSRIEYESSQGKFSLTIPTDRTLLYPIETTVENISKYTAYWIKEQHPELLKMAITVKAYEGINKGCSYTLLSGQGTPKQLSELWAAYDAANDKQPSNPEIFKG